MTAPNCRLWSRRHWHDCISTGTWDRTGAPSWVQLWRCHVEHLCFRKVLPPRCRWRAEGTSKRQNSCATCNEQHECVFSRLYPFMNSRFAVRLHLIKLQHTAKICSFLPVQIFFGPWELQLYLCRVFSILSPLSRTLLPKQLLPTAAAATCSNPLL